MNESERRDALLLLKKVLEIPSVNGRDDEGAVARYLCDVFQKAGVAAYVQEIDERHSNVIAYLKGENSGPLSVWNGHLDTVAYGDLDSWNSDPSIPVERDGRLYCRGASDMKSGLAAMVFALCSFVKSGRKPISPVLFLGTCDEECGGLGAEAVLQEGLLPPCETLLIGEPTGNHLGVAHKGCFWMELEIAGKTSHGAYPSQGCNAVEQGVRLANSITEEIQKQKHPVLGNATAQITRIKGGIAPNMTPDRCTILMDIRPVLPVSTEDLRKMVSSLIQKQKISVGNEALQVQVRFLNARRSFEITETHPLVMKVRESIDRHCGGGKSMGINFFTDASVLLRDRPETAVLLFGPGEPELAHKPNESLVLYKYFQSIEVYRDLLEK